MPGAHMSGYLGYLAQRLGQFVLVVFIGINIAYVITHASPIDPVEQSISAVTSYGNTAPEAIEQMRTSLRDAFDTATKLVTRRESEEGYEASHPQAFFGDQIEPRVATMLRPASSPKLRL